MQKKVAAGLDAHLKDGRLQFTHEGLALPQNAMFQKVEPQRFKKVKLCYFYPTARFQGRDDNTWTRFRP